MNFLNIFLVVMIIIWFIAIPILFHLGKIEITHLVTLLGVVPLAAIAIFQEHIKRLFFAPHLSIEFDLKDPYCSKTPFYMWPNKNSSDRDYFLTKK